MITKTTAALLFAYGYKLIDKEGNEYEITHPEKDTLLLKYLYGENEGTNEYADFDKFGTDYFVLCRPLSSLTETIEHEGNHIVPIVELAKISRPDNKWEVDNEKFAIDREESLRFCVESNGDFVMFNLEGSYHIPNQEALFNKLYEFNFPLSGLDESQIKYIKD